jgi:hypothetical protein
MATTRGLVSNAGLRSASDSLTRMTTLSRSANSVVQRPAVQRGERAAFVERQEMRFGGREDRPGVGNQQGARSLLAHLPFERLEDAASPLPSRCR